MFSAVEDAFEVAKALNEILTWPEEITMDDCIHLHLLRELVSTGNVSVPTGAITFNLVPAPGVDLDNALGGQNLFRADLDAPPFFATLFGKTLNLGPYHMTVRPLHYEITINEADPNSRIVCITPGDPVLYQIDRFCRSAVSCAGPVQR